MKRFSLILAVAMLFCAGNHQVTLEAQTSLASSAVETANVEKAEPTPVQLEGLVTDRKKYSFTITRGNTEYKIKIAENASIGLKMNKPWFDWENNQVVVDALSYDAESDSVDLKATSDKRIAIKLPSENLFLISRFGDKSKIKQFKLAKVKRLNFYLITPEDLGQNMPTLEKPYLSGPIGINDNSVEVNPGENPIPVRLGFRYATMNGFSIAQMEPNKTQVFLSGIWSEGESEILATRILFQPIVGSGEFELPGEATQEPRSSDNE